MSFTCFKHGYTRFCHVVRISDVGVWQLRLQRPADSPCRLGSNRDVTTVLAGRKTGTGSWAAPSTAGSDWGPACRASRRPALAITVAPSGILPTWYKPTSMSEPCIHVWTMHILSQASDNVIVHTMLRHVYTYHESCKYVHTMYKLEHVYARFV